MKLSIIISDTNRSLYYLIYLLENKIFINNIYYFSKDKNVKLNPKVIKNKLLNESIKKLISQGSTLKQVARKHIKKGSKIHKFKNLSVNSEKFFRSIKKEIGTTIIFSGYPGEILSKKFFTLKIRFLHVHAGYLPKYKGSTANYYSILNNEPIGFSAILMNDQIDGGHIIIRKKYDLPIVPELYDLHYDNLFRSMMLIKAIKFLSKSKKLILNKKSFHYYIIHPVLKMLAYRKMISK